MIFHDFYVLCLLYAIKNYLLTCRIGAITIAISWNCFNCHYYYHH